MSTGSGVDEGPTENDPFEQQAHETPSHGPGPGGSSPDQANQGWSGSQVTRDQGVSGPDESDEPDESSSGWSASQVVRDQDDRPDQPSTGWSGSEVVADFGTDQPDR